MGVVTLKLAPAGGGRRATGTCWTTGSGLGFFAFFGFGLFFCAGLFFCFLAGGASAASAGAGSFDAMVESANGGGRGGAGGEGRPHGKARGACAGFLWCGEDSWPLRSSNLSIHQEIRGLRDESGRLESETVRPAKCFFPIFYLSTVGA